MEIEEALPRILAAVPAAESEAVPLAEAHGRILNHTIAARLPLPPFDNSAMDGYAVRSADIAAATASKPVSLRVAGEIPAGGHSAQVLMPGTCIRIFTGSPMPGGADAVVMQEDTSPASHELNHVLVSAPAKPRENVRFRGEDIPMGAAIAQNGDRLEATHLGLLAATGWDAVPVAKRPKVAVVATGSELVEPGSHLRAGKIYESNRIMLAALTGEAGASATMIPLVPDTPEATREGLARAFEAHDIVISSGGVSVGDYDLVRGAFEAIGGQLDFWRIAMKPGRPFVFGRLGQKLLFGLPGNPVSAFVTFVLLVRPALLRWEGASRVGLEARSGTLVEPLENGGDRRHFIRVRLDTDGRVHGSGFQASHVLSSLARANGLVDVPPGVTLAAGSPVKVMLFQPVLPG